MSSGEKSPNKSTFDDTKTNPVKESATMEASTRDEPSGLSSGETPNNQSTPTTNKPIPIISNHTNNENKQHLNTSNETTAKNESNKSNKHGESKTNPEFFENTMRFKNIGFVNEQWTEIVVEDDEECESITTTEVKKAIIQLTERQKHNPLHNWTEKYIRVKHKTYVPVEVNQDRNGRMIYTPLRSINKPTISLGVEIRSVPQGKDDNQSTDYKTDEILTEVDYPKCRRCTKKVNFPDDKIKINKK